MKGAVGFPLVLLLCATLVSGISYIEVGQTISISSDLVQWNISAWTTYSVILQGEYTLYAQGGFNSGSGNNPTTNLEYDCGGDAPACGYPLTVELFDTTSCDTGSLLDRNGILQQQYGQINIYNYDSKQVFNVTLVGTPIAQNQQLPISVKSSYSLQKYFSVLSTSTDPIIITLESTQYRPQTTVYAGCIYDQNGCNASNFDTIENSLSNVESYYLAQVILTAPTANFTYDLSITENSVDRAGLNISVVQQKYACSSSCYTSGGICRDGQCACDLSGNANSCTLVSGYPIVDLTHNITQSVDADGAYGVVAVNVPYDPTVIYNVHVTRLSGGSFHTGFGSECLTEDVYCYSSAQSTDNETLSFCGQEGGLYGLFVQATDGDDASNFSYAVDATANPNPSLKLGQFLSSNSNQTYFSFTSDRYIDHPVITLITSAPVFVEIAATPGCIFQPQGNYPAYVGFGTAIQFKIPNYIEPGMYSTIAVMTSADVNFQIMVSEAGTCSCNNNGACMPDNTCHCFTGYTGATCTASTTPSNVTTVTQDAQTLPCDGQIHYYKIATNASSYARIDFANNTSDDVLVSVNFGLGAFPSAATAVGADHLKYYPFYGPLATQAADTYFALSCSNASAPPVSFSATIQSALLDASITPAHLAYPYGGEIYIVGTFNNINGSCDTATFKAYLNVWGNFDVHMESQAFTSDYSNFQTFTKTDCSPTTFHLFTPSYLSQVLRNQEDNDGKRNAGDNSNYVYVDFQLSDDSEAVASCGNGTCHGNGECYPSNKRSVPSSPISSTTGCECNSGFNGSSCEILQCPVAGKLSFCTQLSGKALAPASFDFDLCSDGPVDAITLWDSVLLPYMYQDLASLFSTKSYNCQDSLKLLLCNMYLPQCTTTTVQVPCEDTCTAFFSKCTVSNMLKGPDPLGNGDSEFNDLVENCQDGQVSVYGSKSYQCASPVVPVVPPTTPPGPTTAPTPAPTSAPGSVVVTVDVTIQFNGDPDAFPLDAFVKLYEAATGLKVTATIIRKSKRAAEDFGVQLNGTAVLPPGTDTKTVQATYNTTAIQTLVTAKLSSSDFTAVLGSGYTVKGVTADPPQTSVLPTNAPTPAPSTPTGTSTTTHKNSAHTLSASVVLVFVALFGFLL